MLRRSVRAVAILATLAFLFPASGCIRFVEELSVYPDGSGKMTVSVGFSLEIFDKLREMGMDPKEGEEQMNFEAKDLENFEGIVAFARPKNEKKDKWQTWTVTAYFDDINKVKMVDKKDGEQPAEVKASFVFKKEGDGYVLEIDDRVMANDQMKGMDEAPEEGQEQQWEMAKQFLKGFEISRGVKMPGPITSADGFDKKDGRTALNKIDEASLKNMKDLSKAMTAKKRKIVCGKSDMSDADVAAFKKELEEAKAAWPKIQEEMKAEAAKKKKASED